MAARSNDHRSDTLTIHASVYKNHMIQIILYVYISDNIADSWLSPFNIASMGKVLLL